MGDRAHVILTLLAKPMDQISGIFGTFAALDNVLGAIEARALCQAKPSYPKVLFERRARAIGTHG